MHTRRFFAQRTPLLPTNLNTQDLVPNLHLASETSQPYSIVADIEGMHEMAVFVSSDTESHW